MTCIVDLIAEYHEWNKAQGLHLGSADEHLHDESLTAEQRAWLADFSGRWEAAAEAEYAQRKCRHRDDGRGRCIDCGAFT